MNLSPFSPALKKITFLCLGLILNLVLAAKPETNSIENISIVNKNINSNIKPNNLLLFVVPPVHNLTQNTFYGTIQAAIDGANPNDVILCDAATYTEAINIHTAVTLRGANFGIPGIGVRGPESILLNCTIDINNAGNTTIDGFHILRNDGNTGPANQIELDGGGINTVQNCIFERNGSNTGQAIRAIATTTAGGNKIIANNKIFGDASGGLFSGHKSWNNGIYVDQGPFTVSITDNTLLNCRSALNIDDMNVNVTVSGNTINNNGTHISFGGAVPTTGTFVMGANNFINNAASTMINMSNVAESFRLDITSSTLNGTLFSALTNAQLFDVEARMAHKEVSASKKGKVIYVTNTQYVNNFTAPFTKIDVINNSVKYAEIGNIINLQAGTYNQRVVIDKSLTIKGVETTKSLYIIDGTGLAPNGAGAGSQSGIVINSGITNCQIKDLTVQKFTGVSGNNDGAIYALLSNNNLTINNVALLNNPTASGLYANGPIDNVSVTNSMVVNNGGGARGIVLWNGLKTNINFSNNMVTNNSCCGIELQDGNASGVTVSGNTIDIGGGDNAIGLTGLNNTLAANLIQSNIITGGGRYGIEIKNPAGGVTVSGNSVTLTTVNADLRDRAGIAVFRRAVSSGNVDVPNGVTVDNNTVDGYKQTSTSEGFGIVVEGTNHMVTGNTIKNCDVAIIQQQNPSNYPGDADQSNLVDLFFGRGNSPETCGNTISGNTFVSNGENIRNNPSGLSSIGTVVNTNTGTTYCTIQAAINAASTLNGHTLVVAAGTYAENIIVSKQLTILGPNYLIDPCSATPRVAEAIVFPATAAISSGEIFHVAASNVTIKGFTINGDNTAITSGYSSTNGADIDAAEGITVYETGINNLTASNNIIKNLSYFGITLYDYPAGVPSSGHTISNNKFQDLGTYDPGSGIDYWGGGVLLYNNQYARVIDNCMINVRLGVQTGNFYTANPGSSNYQQITGNTISARRRGIFHNLFYGTASPYTLSNNTITGISNPNETYWDGILVASQSVSSTVSGNNITGIIPTNPSSGIQVWNVKSTSPALISGGIISGVSRGVFVNNYDSYPSTGSDAPDGGNAVLSNTSINGCPVGIYVKDNTLSTHATVNLSITGGVNVTGGATGLLIENSAATVGSTISNTAFAGQSGDYITLSGSAMDNLNIDATASTFEGSTGATKTLAQNFAVEDKITHAQDNASLGFVLVKSGEDFVTTNSGSIQNGIDDASNGFIVNVNSGLYSESAIVDKSVTILGPNANIDPCTGMRSTEAIVVPKFPNGVASAEIFHVAVSSVVIKGFTIDGDSPLLISGFLGTNGADIDAAEGVTVYETGINGLQVVNNIIQNLSYFGVTLYDYPAGVPSSNHLISNNKFQDLGTYDPGSGIDYWGGGVLLYNNQYAAVTNNCMTNVRIGIQTGNFSQANPGSSSFALIDNNTIQARRRGIFHNLHYGPASPYTLSNNTITGLDHVSETVWDGILLASLSVNCSATANSINGSSITKPCEGYEVWNVKNTTPAVISGGSVSAVDIGVFVNNYDGYVSDAGDGAHAIISSLTISPKVSGTGIRIFDNPLATSNANVQATLGAGIVISGGTDGLVIENTTAKAISPIGNVAFSGQSGKYIKLITNTNNIDATTASFGGITGLTGTKTQLYTIEDKILHSIDDPSLGFVTLKAANTYVTPNSFDSPITTTPSVQRGINSSAAVGTVNIQSGTTYTGGSDATGKTITLSPGASPSCVTITGDMILNSGDVLDMEINGTTACTLYDQFIVNGMVTLGGSTLMVTLGYTPMPGDQITIIDNDMADAVIGQFAQGTSITVSGYPFKIDYAGGSGNDVVLTYCKPTINTCAVTRNIEGCGTASITGPIYSETSASSSESEFENGVNMGDVTDPCSIMTVTYIDTKTGTCPIVVTRTWTVTDAAGGTATCTQTINVDDTTPPSFTSCPTNITVNAANGLCGRSVTYTVPTATDNCTFSIAKVDMSGYMSGDFFPVGTTLQKFEATDACGNVSTCMFNVVVEDHQNPIITGCPGNIGPLGNNPGVCGRIVTWTEPTASDNCPGVTLTVVPVNANGSLFPVGTSTVTYTATDASGLTTTCVFTVTITDTEAPQITCPSNIIQSNDPGMCDAVVTYVAPVGTDNCSGANTTQTAGLASGATYPLGVTTNTFKVTDAVGLMATCSFTVTVNDDEKPKINCPPDIISSTDAGLCSAVVNYSTPVGTDNCPGATTAQILGLASGSAFPKGITTNRFRVTDASGNTKQCNFTVTINDTENPMITCPSNIIQSNDAGLCSAIVNYTTPVGTDNCPGASTIQTLGLPSGSVFPKGVSTNTFKVTDATNKMATCSFTVTVNDDEKPKINCPGDLVNSTDAGLCSAVINYTAPIGTDNCPGATTAQILGLGSGSAFPKGITTNRFRVTDASGNTKQCNFTVTINDTENPMITCPSNIIQSNDAGLCSAVIIYITPVGTDNCPGASTIQNVGLASGSAFPKGITINTFTVTDASGNTKQCNFTVTINDDEKPKINCPADIVSSTDPGLCSAVINYNAPIGTDNCPLATTAQILGLASGSAFPKGITTNRFRVTDASGNTKQCNFTVTINDTENPMITCPSNIIQSNDAGLCSAIVNYATPVGTDNCTGASTIQTLGLPSGSVFPTGVSTNTFKVTDASNNMATCSFTVTVNDDEKPKINCPSDIVSSTDAGLCTAVINYNAPVGTDNCPGATTAQILGLVSGSAFPKGITTNKFRVTDATGNTKQCNFTVTINDAELPVIMCPSNIIQSTDAGLCTTVVNYSIPIGTDNCPGSVTVQMAGLTTGVIYPKGITINTFKVTDASSNTATCTFSVTVNDNEKPVITCPANISVNNTLQLCSAIVNYTAPVGTDNCPSALTVLSSGLASGIVFPVGTTTNVYTVTDASGNTASCSFDVKVIDAEAPVPTCPPNVMKFNDAGLCSAKVFYTATATDNCNIVTVSYSPSSGTVFPVGVSSVTVTATDGASNSAQCSFSVTVKDNEIPILNCPITQQFRNANLNVCTYTIVGTEFDISPTDNCGVLSKTYLINGLISGSNSVAGKILNKGSNSIKWTVTDVNGNISMCTTTVIVIDNQLPSLTCKPDVTKNINLSASCQYYAIGTEFNLASYSDNCNGPYTLSWKLTGATINNGTNTLAGVYFEKGITTITWTITDVSGNSASCSSKLTVIDNIPPTITCKVDQTRGTTAPECKYLIVGSEFDATALDNCAMATTAYSLSGATMGAGATTLAGKKLEKGITTITWTVTDMGGNTKQCSFKVTVVDDDAPGITCKLAQSRSALAYACKYKTIGNEFDLISSTDNCGIFTTQYSITGVTTGSGSNTLANVYFKVGLSTVVWKVTDLSGIMSTCSFTITVNDIDSDCDGVLDCSDQCPGGNDKIDNNNDGKPDCKYPPTYAQMPASWKCGVPQFILICHLNNGLNHQTQCITFSQLAPHLAHGDYCGPCDQAICNNLVKSNENTGSESQSDGLVIRNKEDLNIKVYPNPTTNEFIMSIDNPSMAEYQISVYDSFGKLVRKFKGHTTESEIKFGDELEAGMYTLSIESKEFNKTVRLVKLD